MKTNCISRTIVTLGLVLTLLDPSWAAINYEGVQICPSSCKTCGPCDANAAADPITKSQGSIELSFDLGGGAFERPANFSGLYVASLANMDFSYFVDDLGAMRSYFNDAEVSSLWRAELRLDRDVIDADAFKPDSLTYNHAHKIEVLKVNDVVRQVKTDFFLVDIQSLASPAEGYELNWYDADDYTTKANGLYTLPSPLPAPIKTARVSNPNPGAPYDTLDVYSMLSTPEATQRQVWTRYVFKANGSGNMEHRMQTWTKDPAASGTVAADMIEEEILEYLSGNPGDFNREQVRTVRRAGLSGSGAYLALETISRTYEKYQDITGKERMTESIRLDSVTSNTSGLKTTYGYYDIPSNTLLHGQRRWQRNYDGSWIVWQVTATDTVQTIKKITPFQDGTFVLAVDGSNVGSVVEAEAYVDQTVITGTKITMTRKALGQQIARLEEDFITGASGERVLRYKQYYNATDFFTTYKAFHAYGSGTNVKSGKIAWETHQDGTATAYSYTSLAGGSTQVTVRTGATTGDGSSVQPVITAGQETVTTYTKFWTAIAETVSDIESSLQTTSWFAETEDLYLRPVKVVFNGEANDYMVTKRTCCGPSEMRDRTGAVTTYEYDLLRRKHKATLKRSSTSTPIVTTMTYTGLTTKTERTAGSTTLLVSEFTGSLDGLTSTSKSPDANGDATAETTTRSTVYGAGGVTTTTYPDSTTTISATYRDGSQKSSSDQESNVTTYTKGVHSQQGGGQWRQSTTPITTQWAKSYTDHLGRSFKTEFPDGAVSTQSYYPATASSGARGKVATATDPDENASAGSGSAVSYSYNTEGERTTVTETIADGNSRITVTDQSVADNAETGIGTSYKSTTTINNVLVSTGYRSSDGFKTKTSALNGTSTSVRTVPADGAWTVTSTTPDGQQTVQTYTKGRLQKTEMFDNQTTPVSITSTSYTYDGFDRALTTVDARTGTTSINGYLENGAATSMTTNGGNDTTSYTYDTMGRTLTVTLPDASVTNTSYTPRGQVRATWGSQTYPRFNEYDVLGRMSKLHTWQTAPTLSQSTATAPSGSATTTWLYDSQRGWLVEKNYDGETDNGTTDPDYTYTASGRLLTRDWERGVTTTYSYDQGMLEGVDYSDSTTDLAYAYDAFGRPVTVTQGGNLHTYTYDVATLVLDTETIEYDTDGDGVKDFTRVLDRHQDSILRPSGCELKDGGGVLEHATSYGYDAAGRLEYVDPSFPLPVSPAIPDFKYAYEANSFGLVKTVTGPAHTVTNLWEGNRNVLDSKTNASLTPTTLSAYDYTVNNIGQRTAVATTGTAFGAAYSLGWAYNARGELETEDFGANSSDDPRDRVFQYDTIGNREKTASGSLTLPVTANYSVNALNQYTLVDGVTLPVPAFDSDGNLTDGPLPVATGNASLEWDAENRLVRVTRADTTIIEYGYDYLSRRISKKVGSATPSRYVYDGWNILVEYTGTTLADSYTWGMDLSGSMQGAGGVGGLLAVDDGSASYYPTYDGNGNVGEYLDFNAVVEAHYEYDAFGNSVVATGVKAGDFEHRFSTKPLDQETGLYYYGYRYYDPVTGRWPSRDPIGEDGGVNLYAFVGNDGLNQWDYLGLESHLQRQQRLQREAKEREENKRKKSPKIDPYNGPKELWVMKPEVPAAREFFGYTMAMEALRLTLAPLAGGQGGLGKGQREHGGSICTKCYDCSDGTKRYHVIVTGPTRGGEMGYHPLANRTRNADGSVVFHDVCPEGYEALGSYHSHPLNSGGTTGSPSPADRSRFDNGPRSQHLNQHYADNSANEDNITSGRQMVDNRDPEFVGGVKNPLNPVVWRLPKGEYNPKNAPKAPQNNPCP